MSKWIFLPSVKGHKFTIYTPDGEWVKNYERDMYCRDIRAVVKVHTDRSLATIGEIRLINANVFVYGDVHNKNIIHQREHNIIEQVQSYKDYCDDFVATYMFQRVLETV